MSVFQARKTCRFSKSAGGYRSSSREVLLNLILGAVLGMEMQFSSHPVNDSTIGSFCLDPYQQATWWFNMLFSSDADCSAMRQLT